jgi:small subunit ribosomal protein S16
VATTIRLTRRGAKKRPFYRVVVADSRMPRDGRVIDTIGFYDPISKIEPYRIDGMKAVTWLEDGATMSDTVASLLRRTGILRAWRDGENGAGLGMYTPPDEPVAEEPAAAKKAEKKEEAPPAEAPVKKTATKKETPAEETPAEETPAADPAPIAGEDASEPE